MQKAVVVVDDDPHIRFGLKAGFEQAGYTVVSGPNIETAAAVLDMKQSINGVWFVALVVDYHLERGICGMAVISCMEKLYGGGFRPVLISRTPSFFKALRYQCVS
jgi:DNA-binding NtrC family response regulator